MTLQKILLNKLQRVDHLEVLHELGYRKVTSKLLARLESVVMDHELGMSKNLFDNRYSNIEFITALCSFFNIDIKSYQLEINEIHNSIYLKYWSFKSYIYIDTDFKRTHENVMGLLARSVESPREISLPVYLCIRSLEEQVSLVRVMTRNHNNHSHGDLYLWGKITRYLFFYEKDKYIIFNTKGEVIS